MKSKLHIFVLVLAVAFAYHNSLKCGFVFDDISAVKDNKDLRQNTPILNLFKNDFWGTPMDQERSHKSYRPLCVFTFRLNHLIHGLNPIGYHLINVILHAIVCVQMYIFGCRLLTSITTSFIAALIFSVHPVHTEAVTGVVGRAELLSAIFSFLVLYFYAKSVRTIPVFLKENQNGSCSNNSDGKNTSNVTNNVNKNNSVDKNGSNNINNNINKNVNNNHTKEHTKKLTTFRDNTSWFYMLLALLFVLLATLSKEQGITVVGVCVIYDVFIIRKATIHNLTTILTNLVKLSPHKIPNNFIYTIKRTIFLIITTIILLIARIRIMGTQLPVFTRFDNPAAYLTGLPRILTHHLMLPINSWLLLFPSWLCCDWTMGTIPVVESILDHRNLQTLFFYFFLFLLILSVILRSKNCHLSNEFSDQSSDKSQTLNTNTENPSNKKSTFFNFPPQESNRSNCNTILFISMTILPFIPASNLFFPVGFVVAERILYAPSIGFCFLVATGFEKLINFSESMVKKTPKILKFPQKNLHPYSNKTSNTSQNSTKKFFKHFPDLSAILYLSLTTLIIFFFLKTTHRNEDWLDEHSLFMSGLRVNRRNAKLYNNVGHALENKPDLELALRFFKMAAKTQADDIGAHINVGRTLVSLLRYQEAEVAYRLALSLLPPMIPGQNYTTRVSPNHLNVFINLGNLLVKNSSRLLEADQLLRTAISMRSDFFQAYINRGDVLMRLNRSVEARQEYRKALRHDPGNADIHYNLGVVSVEINHKNEALEHFEKALKVDSDHKPALLNSAILLQEMGGGEMMGVAERRLMRLVTLDPVDEKVHFHLGMLKMDQHDFPSSRHHFTTAINLNPTFRSALFNLALLLTTDMNLPIESVPILEQLLTHHPHHISGLILLGDIAINHLKDLNLAEKCFKSVLKSHPQHTQAWHNLCVVYAERGNLYSAEVCLEKLSRLAPEAEYVISHLNIVRHRIKALSTKPTS